MKNRHYISMFFGLMLPVGLAAQDWTPPTVTGQELELNDTVYAFNVQANLFLNGNGTRQTCVAGEGIALYITQNADGTYKLGTPTDTTDAGAMKYVYYEDFQRSFIGGNPDNAHLNWTIEAQGDGIYYIRPDKNDPDYGEDILPDMWMGWMNDGTDIIYPLIDQYAYTEGIAWKFVGKEEYAVYSLDKALSDAMATCQEYGLDFAGALAVYNNEASTDAEKQAALDVLEEEIYQYRVEHATIDDPVEMSSLLVNPSFDDPVGSSTSDIPGWTQEPVGSFNVPTDGDVVSDDVTIIKRWTGGNLSFSDANIFQAVAGAPDGKYQLEVEYLCIDQEPLNPDSLSGKDPNDYSVTGNYLYAETALGTEKVLLSSNDRWASKVITLDFFVTDGNFVVGVEMKNSTANWFKLGGFKITYYGKDAAKDQLQIIVDRAKHADTTLVMNQGYHAKLQELVKTSEDYIANGATTPQFTEMMATLTQAIADAEENAQAYVEFGEVYDAANEVINNFEGDPTDELFALSDYIFEVEEANVLTTYPYDTEELRAVIDKLDALAQAAEHSLVVEGEDVTSYIVNPSFTEQDKGWTIERNEATKMTFTQDLVDIEGVCDISQTLQGMPNGVYEMTVQAYQRNDWWMEKVDTAWAAGKADSLRALVHSYAYLNDNEVRVKHAFDDAIDNPDFPYDGTPGSYNDSPAFPGVRTNSITKAMMPEQPAGARAYFDKGYYTNTVRAFVIDGTLTFGIRNTGDQGGRRGMVDNFQIKYVGKDLDLALELLKERLDSVEKYLDKKMIGTIKTRINDAYNEGTALLGQGESADFDAVIEVVNELATAADGAEESIEAFELLKHANEVAAADLAYEGVTGTESGKSLQTEYDTYKAAYQAESEDLTPEKVNEVVAEYKELAMAAKIEKGIKNGDDLTYILSNPSYEDQFGLGEGVNGVYNAPWGWTFCIDSVVCTKAEDMNAAGLNNFTSPDQNVLCTDGEWGYCMQTGDFPDVYMYQVVKGLPAGTYKVTVDMVVPNDNNDYRLAGQRLYVNDIAQYYGWDYEYEESVLDQLHPEELFRTYGGYDEVDAQNNGDDGDKGPLNRLEVQVYIEDGDSLVLGVRTDGHWEATYKRVADPEGFNNCGWCKFDNMRLSCVALGEDVTSVEDAVGKDLQVVDRKYYTVDGIQTDGLKRGVNIVRLQYEDGTFETKKVVVK